MKDHKMNGKLNVLIVDDNRTNLALMDMLVRKLPNCTTQLYADPLAFAHTLATADFDIAIFDYVMPNLDGIELTRMVRSQPRLADRPVVMVTVDHDSEIKRAALEAGVVEFIAKPIEPVEFKTRIRNLARLSDAQQTLSSHQEVVRAEVARITAELRAREEEIVSTLARAAGYKDRETVLHTVRMARYCAILAHQLGLAEEACQEIRLAAPMHDIGKAGVRDEVLQKRGFLTDEERAHMAEHTRIGHRILSASRSGALQLAAEIALTHHERWDGSGYPQGLKGEQIPLSGRIAAVADVFDALTSVRPYKTAWTLNNAFNYLHEQAGLQFDPACVSAFERGRDEIAAIMSMMPDAEADAA
ncbi:HD domain-containing phosphohydrolase [Aestuariivirga sp.]|uniref:HD domain-containing phosphohydrolase n=1 Tax=Aestuariivirga sp. TaxID=2650926 RepID=UPI0039194F39